MSIVIQSVGTSGVDISSPTNVTAPTGIQVGDLLFAYIYTLANTVAGITAPAGWTAIGGGTSGTESYRCFYIVATSTEAAASTFDFPNNQGEIGVGTVLRITGADSTAMTNFTTDTSNASGVFAAGDLTPTVANSLIIFCCSNYSNGTISGYACVTSNPTWTQQSNQGPLSGSNFRGALATAIRPETTSTGDFSKNSNNFNLGFFIAIPPAADAAKRLQLLGIGN